METKAVMYKLGLSAVFMLMGCEDMELDFSGEDWIKEESSEQEVSEDNLDINYPVELEEVSKEVVEDGISNYYRESVEWFIQENYVSIDSMAAQLEAHLSNSQWRGNTEVTNLILGNLDNIDLLLNHEMDIATTGDEVIQDYVLEYIMLQTSANHNLRGALVAEDEEAVFSANQEFKSAREVLTNIASMLRGQ